MHSSPRWRIRSLSSSESNGGMRIGTRLSTYLALAPALLIALVAYCGAMGWTIWISFTNSRMLPSPVFVGLRQYASLAVNERWQVSVQNIAIFGVLFIAMALALGFTLAALIDQRVRAERSEERRVGKECRSRWS